MITAIDKNTALVLIDLQKGIAKPEIPNIKDTLANAALLVAAFRAADLPIVIVHVNPMGAAWTKSRVDAPSAPKNTIIQAVAKVALPALGFTDIVDEINTLPTDILIAKKTWNAFYETGLHDELQNRNVTGIVLGGVSTSIGVEGTARAASELGYNISFATDAMTDRVLAAQNNSFQNIFPRIGELGTTEDIIQQLPRQK